mgnify:CR=1 FL=1
MDEKVAAVINKYNAEPGQIVSILQDIQTQYYYLPKEILIEISQTMKIPLSRVFAVATFFRAFSLKPRGRHLINVCLGTACHVRGAGRILEKIERTLGISRGKTTDDSKFTLDTVNCMGCCALGPVIKIDEEYFGQMKIEKVDPLFADYE